LSFANSWRTEKKEEVVARSWRTEKKTNSKNLGGLKRKNVFGKFLEDSKERIFFAKS